MDIALVIVASAALAISMACLGYFAAIRQQTLDDLAARATFRAEFEEIAKKLVGEHNKLVGQIAETREHVSAIDMKASGVMGRGPTMARKP